MKCFYIVVKILDEQQQYELVKFCKDEELVLLADEVRLVMFKGVSVLSDIIMLTKYDVNKHKRKLSR